MGASCPCRSSARISTSHSSSNQNRSRAHPGGRWTGHDAVQTARDSRLQDGSAASRIHAGQHRHSSGGARSLRHRHAAHIMVEQRLETIQQGAGQSHAGADRAAATSPSISIFRKHVAVISGIYDEMAGLLSHRANTTPKHRRFHAPPPVKVLNMLESGLNRPSSICPGFELSPDLPNTVALITGMQEEIDSWERSEDPEAATYVARLKHTLDDMVEELARQRRDPSRCIGQIEEPARTWRSNPASGKRFCAWKSWKMKSAMIIRNRGL